VSHESSIDVGDFGLLMKESSVEKVIESVKAISSLSTRELEERSRNAWEYARSFYTRDNYKTCDLDFVSNVLGVAKRS